LHRVRGAELPYGHEPRDEIALRNPDRNLVRKVAVDGTLADFVLADFASEIRFSLGLSNAGCDGYIGDWRWACLLTVLGRISRRR